MTVPALQDALTHLIKGIVSNPEDVHVKASGSAQNATLEVRVNPVDLGRVIGRQGRTVQALRTVISAIAHGERVRIDVADTASESL